MENLKQQLSELKEETRLLSGRLDIKNKRSRVKELEFEMSDPDLWKNREVADIKIKELGELNDLIKRFEEVEKIISELRELSHDKKTDFINKLYLIQRKIRELEMERLFVGKYDKQSAIISIYSGAGGQDAEDWVAMLYEMYNKFCEGRGWKIKIIDETISDFQSKTGRRTLKNITIDVKGQYAYGYLKKEYGVHRLVRISPFSPEKKRHTSFALVEVLPDLPDLDQEIKIPEEDLKIEFSRSSGPGGQNVNKVETAVRIVHLPTGIVGASQSERSQSQNREKAMNVLKVKLIKLMEETQTKEINQLKNKIKPEWGSQIRSYVLNPYQLVKDHRNNTETSQVDKVLNGDLDKFIEAEIQ